LLITIFFVFLLKKLFIFLITKLKNTKMHPRQRLLGQNCNRK